jgi:hypothetical protein
MAGGQGKQAGTLNVSKNQLVAQNGNLFWQRAIAYPISVVLYARK